MNREQLRQLLELANVRYEHIDTIENQYWPKHPNYDEVREKNPWYHVHLLKGGYITVGPRKRVYVLDWANTKHRGIVTPLDVSKGDTYVHAWNLGELISHMRNFQTLPELVTSMAGEVSHVIRKPDEIVQLLRHMRDWEKEIISKQQIAMLERFVELNHGEEIIMRYVRSEEGFQGAQRVQLKAGNNFIEVKSH